MFASAMMHMIRHLLEQLLNGMYCSDGRMKLGPLAEDVLRELLCL